MTSLSLGGETVSSWEKPTSGLEKHGRRRHRRSSVVPVASVVRPAVFRETNHWKRTRSEYPTKATATAFCDRV